jgi:hypothetical protein
MWAKKPVAATGNERWETEKRSERASRHAVTVEM